MSGTEPKMSKKRLMEIKLSEDWENDLLNTLIISAWNVCKMLYVMEVVSLDVGTLTARRTWLLHGKDLVRQCPPLGLNFKPSLMVIVLNSALGMALFAAPAQTKTRYSNGRVRHDSSKAYHFGKGPQRFRNPIRFLISSPLKGFCGLRPIRKLKSTQWWLQFD